MPLIQYPGDKEPRTYTDEEKEAIDKMYADIVNNQDTRIKCVCACIDILDMNCENPSRICASCRRRNRCDLSVKLAHDALCGCVGIKDTIRHDKWHALMKWRNTFK